MADSVDTLQFLKLVPSPDGTLTRPAIFPNVPASDEPHDSAVISKDFPLNSATGTFLRAFKPNPLPTSPNLPVILYFHGGGFIAFSATSLPYHKSCADSAVQLRALVLSLEYRLAPEHRLPAAYDDAVEALRWIAAVAGGVSAEPWLSECADFTKCFVMGSSAGGNMVYHAGLRALDLDLSPMVIRGLWFNQPFFGGVHRTESELCHVSDHILPLAATDLMWNLALPEGADRNHEYSNPTVANCGVGDERIKRLPRSLVTGYGGDPLVDRQKEFVELLKKRGVHVETHFEDGGFHAAELFESAKAEKLNDVVSRFIRKSCLVNP
ncbi:hypothetical protein CsatB_011934 [Cannabis sativa]